jgi:Fe-S-cluster containining protein
VTEPTFLEQASAAALAVLGEISATTDAFAATSGIKCRAGCGQCCLKPGIEAMPVELLPLAHDLHARGEADAVYAAAAAAPEGRCVFYRPHSAEDETLGRCGTYALRPSLCRLFGFAAVSGKDGRPPALAACHWHKRLQPEAVAAAQAAIDRGGEVPLFSAFTLRLAQIAPGTALAERLPINRALMTALEKVALSRPEPTR